MLSEYDVLTSLPLRRHSWQETGIFLLPSIVFIFAIRNFETCFFKFPFWARRGGKCNIGLVSIVTRRLQTGLQAVSGRAPIKGEGRFLDVPIRSQKHRLPRAHPDSSCH
jgi:hypothetical protein